MENVQMNVINALLKWIAMKIASIASEHGETNVLDGDNVIAGLVIV